MNCAACELGRYQPVPELQVLAAVERAQRHSDRVNHHDVAEHLGFVRGGATTRRLRPRLVTLRDDGSLATERYHQTAIWTLTARGRGRLGAARRRGALDPLPESPQHRTWRRAREQAATRLEGICGSVLAALEEADAVMGGGDSRPGDSTAHFEVGERLGHEFWRLGVAVHCLREWPEPDDPHRDVDGDDGAHAGRRAFFLLKERQG